MRTGLHRWLTPALAAAFFAPVLVTLWVGLHVARHHDDAGHHHGAAHQHEAGHHHEARNYNEAGHHDLQHHFDGTTHHSHVTPDPRHEPAARRGLMSAPAPVVGSVLQAVLPPPEPAADQRGPTPVHRGPPIPLFASHCALLL